MLPAVIFHVPESDDVGAIDAVERVEAGVIVPVGGIWIVMGTIGHLAVVLYGFERGPNAGAHDVVRTYQVDHALGVHESAGGRVRNVDEFTGILGCIEDRKSRTSERASNLRYAGRLLRGRRRIRCCD